VTGRPFAACAIVAATVAALAALAAAPIAAAGPPGEAGAGCSTRVAPIQLTVENDSLVGQRQDGGYTSGIRLEAFGGPAAGRTGFDHGIEAVAGAGLGTRCTSLTPAGGGQRSLFLSQSLYTPSDLTRRTPQPDDHPWAAMLSFGRGWDVVGVQGGTTVARRVELAVDVVGSAALGEKSQRIAHRLIDGDDPQGWDNQLRNRWGLSASVLERRLWPVPGGDVIGHWGAALGQILTHARLGATWRYGRTGCTLATPGVVAHSIALGGSAARCDDPVSASRAVAGAQRYLFAGFDIRRVVRNEILEGTPRAGGSTISAEPWVGELRAGFAWGEDDWLLSYALTHRSGDYRNGAGNGPGPATYAAITLAVSW
jgi:lipid A 3-O-deacylase